MGSITHNSAEANRGSSKGGMLSKLKGSFISSGSKSTAGSTKSKSKNGLAKSYTQGPGSRPPPPKVERKASNSFTNGDSTIEIPNELKESFASHDAGVPTSVIALVDAPSCITHEFDEQPNQPYHQEFRPQMLNKDFRGSMMSSGTGMRSTGMRSTGMMSYGTTDSAARALSNLHVGGSSADQGGRQQHNMVPVQNSGYNNYTEENYDDNGEQDYYDENGGGIFDDSYMKTSRISVSAHQPPPPDRGYNRRSTNAEYSQPERGYRPSERGNNRRSSFPEEVMPDRNVYPISYYRGSSDGDAYPGCVSLPPPTQSKRNSIDNSDSTPRRRASGQYDPRGSVEHHSVGHNSGHSTGRHEVVNNTGRDAGQTAPRRPTVIRSNSIRMPATYEASSNSESTEPSWRHNIVNNTGRDAGQLSNSQTSRLSGTVKDNPPWFIEANSKHSSSESTEPIRNAPLRSSRCHEDDDDRTMATMGTMATKAYALRPGIASKAKDMTYPQGDLTIVYTDVQGSTSFWESCPSDMKDATDIHDIIMRQCYTNHSGYEISTEGDSFNLAFQHPMDALAFALQAQLKLYNADWPEGILKHPEGKDEPGLKFRGFRVRFGIHHGPTTSRVHEMTGRTVYSGEGVKIAKEVEGMCHGGQILTTMETWKAVSGMAERYLGRPQILDCGEHLLFESKNQKPGSNGYTTTRYTRRIMQLVPSDLAFDFFEARGRRDVPSEDGQMGFEIKDASSVNGRLFPPLTSKRQLTTCFLNSPYANGKVTICFVYTVGLDDNPDNRAQNLGVLAKYVRKQLIVLNPPGYECQEDNGCWMLAFDRMAHAVTFGLQLKSTLQGVDDLVGSADRDNMFKVGIISGAFTSMGPHKTTGMADYFGPIVNRAARVASNCEPGQVCVGIPLTNGVTADPPDFGSTVSVRLQGIKKLKGITLDVAIFECSKRRIETPYR